MKKGDGRSLTVIIPTWNQRELLRRCLQSLQAQTVSCSVLVVDNGSVDSTHEMVCREFTECVYLELGGNLGFAKAVNAGIRQTKSPYVALLNNDTEADRRWVEAGLKALEAYPDYWLFASRMIDYTDRDQLDSAGDCYSRTGLPYKRGLGEPPAHFPDDEPVMGASAGAAFYRRELFDRIGLFDERYFMYLEDVDLSLRAQLAGLPCLYLAEARVYHLEAASDPDRRTQPATGPATRRQSFHSSARVYWITRNRWLMMITYQPLRHLPWLIYGWTRSLFFHLLRAGFTGAFLRGISAGVTNSPYAIRKRLSLRKTRRISVKELWRQMKAC
ncbi:MAG: glycosyltransferase family 2 protein [Acidobacteriota bacterium]